MDCWEFYSPVTVLSSLLDLIRLLEVQVTGLAKHCFCVTHGHHWRCSCHDSLSVAIGYDYSWTLTCVWCFLMMICVGQGTSGLSSRFFAIPRPTHLARLDIRRVASCYIDMCQKLLTTFVVWSSLVRTQMTPGNVGMASARNGAAGSLTRSIPSSLPDVPKMRTTL